MLDMGFEPQIRRIIAGLPQDFAATATSLGTLNPKPYIPIIAVVSIFFSIIPV